MKENTQFLLGKAESAIGAAESLLRDGYRDFSAGRAYYAMFYTAEALLAEKELAFKKHVGVHKAFSEHFIKTGIFGQKYYQWLIAAFNSRLVGDYAIHTEFEDDEVQEWINQAREFLNKVREYLVSL
ncbi:MAG TPA: HEPN domain-containing protein [Anaerolineales bacterium]|nr:HEPN domain-containing protein [Anaerolineales bacterium]